MRAIVIGGSAGALDPLSIVIAALPATLRVPVVAVLHLPSGQPSHAVEVLAVRSRLPVKEAEDKEQLVRGMLYVAPPGYHLLVETAGHFALSVDEPVHFSRPAIDVLFETVAEAYGAATCGVLLSGASEDGARGLARIHAAGGITLVQALDTAAYAQMPRSALRMFTPTHVLAPAELGAMLASLAPHAEEPHP